MTYSHNTVSNHLKMTTTAAAAAATTSIRLKNASQGGNSGGSAYKYRSSPPTTPPIFVHSNSIVSSTNHNHHVLSSSPPDSMSSGASTSSNCSSSSNISSAGSSGYGSSGFYAEHCRSQRYWQQQIERHSPQQYNLGGGSFYTSIQNNLQRHNGVGVGVNIIGSAHKQRDAKKSPNAQTRHSAAVILGGGVGGGVGGVGDDSITSSVGGSGRKNRAKHSMNQNALTCGVGAGKISPTHPLIPTALTHFAGSKCFDAPSPTALPKPPQHWTLIEGKKEKANSSAGPGLQSVTNARKPTMHAVDAHTHGGHVVKTSKRNLLDDFDTHNLKLLLNVHS